MKLQNLGSGSGVIYSKFIPNTYSQIAISMDYFIVGKPLKTDTDSFAKT